MKPSDFPNMSAVISLTYHNLKTAGNKAILRRLRNKGYHWGPHLHELSEDLYELHDGMYYLIELDHGWSKEYTRLHRSYRQCCRKIIKHMRKTDKYYKKHDRKEVNNETVDR